MTMEKKWPDEAVLTTRASQECNAASTMIEALAKKGADQEAEPHEIMAAMTSATAMASLTLQVLLIGAVERVAMAVERLSPEAPTSER